jgi:GTPase SAR1 family protein
MMANYVLLKKGLSGIPQLVKPDEVMDIIETDLDKDWYQSVFYYNDEHVKQLKEKGTLTGVTDIKTDKLVFDFDDVNSPENAKKDAFELTKRLETQGIKTKDIEVYFSSNKGFHIIVTLTNQLTPRQTGIAAKKLAGDLNTFDSQIYNASRILRVPWTKNQKSGLHKIPLTVNQLKLPIDKIKSIASNIDNVTTNFDWSPVENLPQELFEEKEQPKKETVVQTDLDLTNKPRHWPDYKWALLNAVQVKDNERHEALMRIAATCRGLGYPEEMARALCLTFDEKFVANTGKPEVEDLETNILKTVYSDSWSGGTYSIKTDAWLQDYAKRVGLETSKDALNEVKNIGSVFSEFEDFSQNFESNIIKTGITELDENSLFLTSTHNGILGQPGSGKTSFIIQWLEHLSSQNQHCFFYSLDMAESIIGAKLIQRVTGLPFTEAISLSRRDPVKYEAVKVEIKEKFKNVNFIFTSGTKVENIKDTIIKHEKETGNKVRFLCVDYLECLQGPYSDSTANTGYISQQLKDLASETKVCSVILLQTQKATGEGEVSEPILSMKKIKGSSIIEQSASVLLTLWREGYSPKFQQFDKYMSFAIVKNRFGPLWTDDFSWNGAKGAIIGSLSDEQQDLLQQLRDDKRKEKSADAAEKAEWN